VVHRIDLHPPELDGSRVRFRWSVEPKSRLYRRCEFSLRFPRHVPIGSLPERVWWWVALACLHPHWLLLEPCEVRLPVTLGPGERKLWLRLMTSVRASLDAHRGDEPQRPHVEIREEGPRLPSWKLPSDRARCATAFSGGKDSLLQVGLLSELTHDPVLVAVTSVLPKLQDHEGPRRRKVFREIVRRRPVTWVEVESDYRSVCRNRFPRELGFGVSINELTDTLLYASALVVSGLALGSTHFFVASETEVQETVTRHGHIIQHPHGMYSTATLRTLGAALAPEGIHLGSLTVPLHSWQVQRLLWTRYTDLCDLQLSCWRARGREAACSTCSQCLRLAYGALAAGGLPSRMGVDLTRLLEAHGDRGPPAELPSGEEVLPGPAVGARLDVQTARLIATTPLQQVQADLGRGFLRPLRIGRQRRACAVAEQLKQRMVACAPPPLAGIRPAFSHQLDPLLRDRVEAIYRDHFEPEEPCTYAAAVTRSDDLARWLTDPVRGAGQS
jgi:hypothetical protein